MACRGVHFGLSNEQRETLLGFDVDEDRLDYVQEVIERAWDEEFLQETDKAWDAIHRCMIDHAPFAEDLDWTGGTYPLNRVISGGRQLYADKTRYVLSLVEADEVAEVAAALRTIGRDWMRERYFRCCEGAWPEYGEEDWEYTWSYFEAVRSFYLRMAEAGRAVLFTVDQ